MHSNNTAKGNLKVFHRKRYCCQVLKTAETMMMSPNWRLVDRFQMEIIPYGIREAGKSLGIG